MIPTKTYFFKRVSITRITILGQTNYINMNILFKNDSIRMIYESLIIAIFCDGVKDGYYKYMDPLEFGSQDSYSNFVETEGTEKFEEGKLRIAAALGALAFRFPDDETAVKVRELFDELTLCKNQQDIVSLIQNIVEVVEVL